MSHTLRSTKTFFQILVAFVFGFFATSTLRAQSFLPCHTHQMVEKSLAEHPELRENLRMLEREYAQALASRSGTPGGTIRIIPVVFHIIHTGGADNISDAQVHDAVRIMNEDFKRLARDTNQVSATFRDIMGTTNFEFRLARIAPNGDCTNGITRTFSTLTNSAGDNVKALINWNTRQYLNIWVVNNITSGAGAYAYYPGTAPGQNNEGIVTRNSQCGSIGTSGGSNFAARTLTHETGHYFNLPHTWGNSNNPGLATNCNIDDGVGDTPNTIGVADQGCDLGFTSCGGILANVENYMDYSSCGRMFTIGQAVRMRTAAESIAGARSSLWTNANLIATGVVGAAAICAPQASFNITQSRICPGGSIQPLPSITNAPIDTSLRFEWNFPGGVPTTSTEVRPTVFYNTEGRYNIQLVVYNQAGRDTFTVNNAIFVTAQQPAYGLTNVESFENATFPQAGSNPFNQWVLEGGVNGWNASSIASFDGTRSLRIFSAAQTGATPVAAISPRYDLSTASNATYVLFKYAAARRTTSNTDVFKIYTSTNCGRTYSLRVQRIGNTGNFAAYTTQQLFTGSFRPQPTDWRTERIAIGNAAGQPDVRLRFELVPGGGSNFFIDSLVVIDPNQVTSVLRPISDEVELAPNPATTQVQVSLPASGTFSYTVQDILGKSCGHGTGTGVQFLLDVRTLPAGTYVLSIRQGTQLHQKRFLVQPTPNNR